MIYFDLKLKYEIHNKFKFEFVFVLYNKEMNTTINPETGRKVIIGGPTYRRMAKKYYTDRNGQLLDQIKPTVNMSVQTTKSRKGRVGVKHPETGKTMYVGSKRWNEVYHMYNWDGKNKKFTDRRQTPLSQYEGSVSSRREYRKHFANIFNDMIGRKEYEMIHSDMGYTVEYFNLRSNNGVTFAEQRCGRKMLKKYEHKLNGSVFEVRKRGEDDFNEVNKLNLRERVVGGYVVEEDVDVFKNRMKMFLQKGYGGNKQFLVSIETTDLFMKEETDNEGNRSIMYCAKMIKDERVASDRIVKVDNEDEYIKCFLKFYEEAIEGIEMMGSGWRYVGNLGVQMNLLPLKVYVGAGIKTPAILGECVVNPCINDNRCLQRCLILAYNGSSIIKNCNTTRVSGYSKYWNKPIKNPVFGHTILEIENAMNIADNQPFIECVEKFEQLENLLNVYINCYEMRMFDGFDMKSMDEKNLENMVVECVYPVKKNQRIDIKQEVNLCMLNDEHLKVKHFVLIKDMSKFKQHLYRSKDNVQRNTARLCKCRWCDFSAAKKYTIVHEIKMHGDEVPEEERYILGDSNTYLKWQNQRYTMPVPVVVYADFECCIDKDKQHKPILLSCVTVSKIDNVKTEYKVFHAEHEDERDLIPFIDYLMHIKQDVCAYLFDEMNLEWSVDVEKDYDNTSICPFCHCGIGSKDEVKENSIRMSSCSKDIYFKEGEIEELIKTKGDAMNWYADELEKRRNADPFYQKQIRMKFLETMVLDGRANDKQQNEYEQLKKETRLAERVKVRHHAHVSGEYSNGECVRYYKAGEYICTCCDKCNLQLSFNKKYYKLPVYFHNGMRYDNAYIMRLLGKYKALHPKAGKIEEIPSSMDKEMMIEMNGIQFKDSYKMISAPLKRIVSDTLGKDLNNYRYTKLLLKQYLEDHNKPYDESYIELMTRKEPMFYGLITSYKSLSTRHIPKQEECYDDLSQSFMCEEDYQHMKLLWKTFNIRNWGEYYELYNLLDVTLLADCFEHFRDSTMKSFGVDSAHYLTTPQMSYSLFLKNVSNKDDSRYYDVAKKWAGYQMKIGKNENHSEEEMIGIFMDRMSEFNAYGGIRLLGKNDMNEFICLKNNLRGGLTQISTRYSQNECDDESMYYLDANNLYGGVMHRMMPYNIVHISDKEKSKILNSNPIKWIESLDTYDKYGYFIECDIEVDDNKHDYFNDLPLFPSQKYGVYSNPMKKFANDFDIDDLNKKESSKKLICDLLKKEHYVVHYSMLQLGIELGYKVTKIHNVIKFRQAPFIYEYVNLLSEMRAKSKTGVLKNLFKLLANSIYGKFVETGLKRMKVKFATTKEEQNSIIAKYSIDLLDEVHLYDTNLWAAKIANPQKRMSKPFFIGFAILDMSKYIIYDFYYNVLKRNMENVCLLGQDTDSLIVKIKDKNRVFKLCELYKYFDFSELDHSSSLYHDLEEYYNEHIDKREFGSFDSFVNLNKKVPGPIFKDEHQGNRIVEFAGLKPKMYCIVDEKDVVHNAAKGVPRSMCVNGVNVCVKNMELYKKTLFPENKVDAKMVGEFSRINNRGMKISTVKQKKIMFTALDNKRYVCEDNVHTLAWGHYSIPVDENAKYCDVNRG